MFRRALMRRFLVGGWTWQNGRYFRSRRFVRRIVRKQGCIWCAAVVGESHAAFVRGQGRVVKKRCGGIKIREGFHLMLAVYSLAVKVSSPFHLTTFYSWLQLHSPSNRFTTVLFLFLISASFAASWSLFSSSARHGEERFHPWNMERPIYKRCLHEIEELESLFQSIARQTITSWPS